MGSLCSKPKPNLGAGLGRLDCDGCCWPGTLDHQVAENLALPPPLSALPQNDELPTCAGSDLDQAAARAVIAAHDSFIRSRDPSIPLVPDIHLSPACHDAESYHRAREVLVQREAALAFDHPVVSSATPLERRVADIIAAVRARDDADVYAAAPPRSGYGSQRHPRFAGDHFLANTDLISQTGLFRIACRMPKGAHLHIHFNACLQPRVLLGLAATMDRMFVTSNLALGPPDSWHAAMIEFSILPAGKEFDKPGNLFSPDYLAHHTMRFHDFLAQFPVELVGCSAMDWLERKITFAEQEAHSVCQTALGYVMFLFALLNP